MRGAPWSDERIEQLKLLWAGGATAQEIAAQLGCVSRSAVLGKIFRLRLDSASAAPAAPDGAESVADDSLASQSPPRQRRRRGPRADAAPQIGAKSTSPQRTRGKNLLELTNTCCRWPHGRPGTRGFFFCGAPGADLERGRPYCDRHARRAYRVRRPPAEATTNLRRIAPGDAPSICAAVPAAAPARHSMWRSAVRHPAPRWR